MSTRKAYTTDLSDREWRIIEPLLPGPKRLGRKIEYGRREILNAIFYLNRNGCTWRDLPGDFPPYGIVSHYYHAWRQSGLWQVINDTFRIQLRVTQGRNAQPSATCLDSQSVKTTEIASSRGYDAGKKVKGRKRHILVDTMSKRPIVVVHAASIQDRDGAKLVLAKAGHLTRLTHIWADGTYAGELIHWVKTACQCLLEIVKRSDKLKGFQVLPRRWVLFCPLYSFNAALFCCSARYLNVNSCLRIMMRSPHDKVGRITAPISPVGQRTISLTTRRHCESS